MNKSIVVFWLVVFFLISCMGAVSHSLTAAQFISQWEGKRNRAYRDTGGQPTICYGTAYYTQTKPVRMGDYRSDHQCYTLLLQNITYKQRQIARYYPRFWHLNNNQRIALTSLVFNIGLGNFQKSRTLACLKKGCSKTQTASTFHGWVKDGRGVRLSHLVKRRKAEASLYLK